MFESALGWVTLAGVLGWAVSFTFQLTMLGIVPGNRKPQTAMAWLLFIFVAPWIGLIAFFFFGSANIGRKRHQHQAQALEAIAEYKSDLAAEPPPDVPDYLPALIDMNRKLASMPLTTGNSVELLPDYQESIDLMIEAIDTAQFYVHVEFYIMALDPMTEPFFDALDRATARGVDVRLLFDHLGTRGIPGYRDLLKRLRNSDIEWQKMMPLLPLKGKFRRPDLRNHRKLLVVDDQVGFTGSLNLTHPSYNKPKNEKIGRGWVDLWMRVDGPAVASIDVLFAADWYVETGEILRILEHRAVAEQHSPDEVASVPAQLVPSGPGFPAETNLRLFNALIYAAKKRISITSPYFVPDESLLYAVTTAAQRGIDIELFVSEKSDQFMVGHAQASYYRSLLQAGIKIYLYPEPAVLHSKCFSIDDDIAVVGTSNMDMRSFALNYEMSMLMIGHDIVSVLREVEDHYRALSRELTLDEWESRPAGQKYLDNVMRLTATLM